MLDPDKQLVLIVEGPDGCGKTEISKALAEILRVPYFKVSTERKNWAKDTFKYSLWFDAVLPQFLKATKGSVIMDRGFPSEWVYPQVFNRNTDYFMLTQCDDDFAELGAILLYLTRRDFSNNREDDLIPNDKLAEIDRLYQTFAGCTKMKVVKMFVDDYGNDLSKQIPVLSEQILGHLK